MTNLRSLPTDDQVRAIFSSASVTTSELQYQNFMDQTQMRYWVDSAKTFNSIRKVWIDLGILTYIKNCINITIDKLDVYNPSASIEKHDIINIFSDKLDEYNHSINELIRQYVDTSKTKSNDRIFQLIAQPYPKRPSAWRDTSFPNIRSAAPEWHALFDSFDEEARQWEKSPAGLEWLRHWNEFHDDMDCLLNDEAATAIERLRNKIDAAHRRIDENIADDAPKALWRFQFAFDMCWYWRNLYSALPGSNPDHPVVGFVEAAWHTVLECAEEAISNPGAYRFKHTNHEQIAEMRRLLPKCDLERWMSLSWERPIRSAVRKLRG